MQSVPATERFIFSMSQPTKGTVYALLTAIGMLLAGIAVLVWVDSRRVRRFTDEINALHYRVDSQEVEIRRLRQRKQTDSAADISADSIPPKIAPIERTQSDGWN